MPRVEWLNQREQVDQIANDWNRLNPQWPTQRIEWLSAAWEAFSSLGKLHWAIVRDDQDRVIGGLPLYRSSTLAHGRLLSLVGSGSICSDGGGVTAEPGFEKEVVQALADSLLGNTDDPLSPSWDELEWDGVSAKDSITQNLIDQFLEAGAEVVECGTMSTWRVEIGTRNATKFSDLVSRSTRRKIRRLDDKLNHPSVSFHQARNQDEFEAAQDFAIHLHQERQTSIGHAGCFADSRFEKFYRGASGKLFSRGLWRLYWVAVDGRPAAFYTGAFYNNVQYTYQTGLDPNLAEWEPGWLLQLHLLERGLAERWDAIDFMRGDHAYKRLLGGVPTACRRIRVCNHSWAAQGRFKLYHFARNVKHWWDSVPNTLPSLPGESVATNNTEVTAPS